MATSDRTDNDAQKRRPDNDSTYKSRGRTVWTADAQKSRVRANPNYNRQQNARGTAADCEGDSEQACDDFRMRFQGLLPNVAMSRAYGWRGGCSAADAPDVGVGSVEWFGCFSFATPPESARTCFKDVIQPSMARQTDGPPTVQISSC